MLSASCISSLAAGKAGRSNLPLRQTDFVKGFGSGHSHQLSLTSVLPAGFCPAGSFSLFERGFCCKHPHLRHTPPDHTCRHSLPGDCLTPFFSRFRGRFLLRLSFFISFLHNESGDARSSVSPDWCYLLLHGNMLARSALFQVEKRCAARSCRRKPEQ